MSLRIPLAFASLLLAVQVHAAEREWLPYRKLVDVIKLDKLTQLTVKAAGGDKRYASDARHHVRLKLDEDMLKENPLVEVSMRPLEAEIDE